MQSTPGPSTIVLTEKRGLKACTACRIAKVRCHLVPEKGICVRCQSAAIPCKFTATRRGRVKGSKNIDSSHDAELTSWTGGHRTFLRSEAMDDQPAFRVQSPLDPFVSGISTLTSPVPFPSRPMPKTRPGMTRRTVQTMAGSFPIGSERAVSESVPGADFSSGRDVHNPLLFLAECARRGWDTADGSEWKDKMVVPAPITYLPLEDAIRLGRWSKENLGKIITDQRKYFQLGLHGSKRDVSVGLDPVYQHVIKEDQVDILFGSYFRHVHCQWGMLDRDIHTSAFVRSRSAFLFTAILALGATSIATLTNSTPQQRILAIKLWAHLEKLQLVVSATAAKSVEIVQGMMLAQMWALRTPRLVDDQRAARLGMAVRMAGQIGLQLARNHGSIPGERNSNDLRTRLSLVLVESRWESIADRQEISCQGLDLTDFEAEELDRTGPFEDIALMAADYALYRFEAESKERIHRISSTTRSTTGLDSERIWIQTYLESWNKKWVSPQTDPLRKWWFQYLSIRSHLVGILRVAKARSGPGSWSDQMRSDLILVSIELLEGCLSHKRAMHMLRPTSPIVFAAAILLRLTSKEAPERDLILRVALRLAGEPEKEDIVTYAVHNGYQILNMLCLSKEATEVSHGSTQAESSNNDIIFHQSSVSSSITALPEDDTYQQNFRHTPPPQADQTQAQRIDPMAFLTLLNHQPVDDIGVFLGLTGTSNGNGNGSGIGYLHDTSNVNGYGNANTTQWDSSNPRSSLLYGDTASNPVPMPSWDNFLSTEPFTSIDTSQGSMIDHRLQAGNGSTTLTNNANEEELFGSAGEANRQMSDNAISDFYFHLASALGS
uniref:Zn(2)-C6 fungal-type domain-containing protein n=1 Tax=Kwoniella pini CBS 10737 TaxID=1296096 RepID=A0A1B9IA90_9TREE|nr:uncharacterized protein I206_01756 [Kwoniella pini CBS 10737]OCF52466.1 hypothetical protein I206_01756 [Kwoniella pini CBS 10737]